MRGGVGGGKISNFSSPYDRAYMRKYNAAHHDDEEWLEKRRAAGRRYQAAHREQATERCRQWRIAHPDYQKQWYHKMKEKNH